MVTSGLESTESAYGSAWTENGFPYSELAVRQFVRLINAANKNTFIYYALKSANFVGWRRRSVTQADNLHVIFYGVS